MKIGSSQVQINVSLLLGRSAAQNGQFDQFLKFCVPLAICSDFSVTQSLQLCNKSFVLTEIGVSSFSFDSLSRYYNLLIGKRVNATIWQRKVQTCPTFKGSALPWIVRDCFTRGESIFLLRSICNWGSPYGDFLKKWASSADMYKELASEISPWNGRLD